MNEQLELPGIKPLLQKNGDYKTKKINVLMLSQWYPLTMSRYFERAFQRRDDVELRTIGPYTGANIPWKGGMILPIKYAKSPYYPTYPNTNIMPWSQAKLLIGDWKPDLVITVDAGIRFDNKPDVDCPVVHVATDPHVLNYDVARSWSDKFFNMQRFYSQDNDIYLPYAFDPTVHYIETNVKKEVDCALIGMPYPTRNQLVTAMNSHGITVNYQNGPVFDEYRWENCKANIGINYSSLNDMTARVFELMAMGLTPLLNRVPDLPIFFEEGYHYLGFSSIEEAVSLVLDTPKAKQIEIANNAYNCVWKPNTNLDYNNPNYYVHSYDSRVYQILKESGIL